MINRPRPSARKHNPGQKESPELSKEEFPETYIGWMPNSSGRVSFSSFGTTNWPKGCVGENLIRNNQRVVIFVQKRMHCPSMALPWVYSLLTRSNVHFLYAINARSRVEDGKEIMAGTVYRFAAQVWNKGTHKKAGKPHDLFVRALGYWNEDDRLNALDAFMADVTEANYEAKCAFKMDRFGIITLQSLDISADENRTLHTADTPLSAAEKRNNYYQKFFLFLKDIIHDHKHHPKSTPLLAAYKLNDAQDLSWVRNTMCTLNRAVISNRRTSSRTSLSDAMGIASYMNAFHKIIGNAYPDASKATDITRIYNTREAEDSIKASLEKYKNARTQYNLLITGGSAIAFSIILILNNAHLLDEIYKSVGVFLHTQHMPLSLILFIISFSILAYIIIMHYLFDVDVLKRCFDHLFNAKFVQNLRPKEHSFRRLCLICSYALMIWAFISFVSRADIVLWSSKLLWSATAFWLFFRLFEPSIWLLAIVLKDKLSNMLRIPTSN
jgi:hypothetical protein